MNLPHKQQLLALVASGKTEKALKLFLSISAQQDDELYQEAVLLSNRLKNYSTATTRNTLSFEQKNIGIAQINDSLMILINRLDDDSFGAIASVSGNQNNAGNWNKIIGVGVLLLVLIGIYIVFNERNYQGTDLNNDTSTLPIEDNTQAATSDTPSGIDEDEPDVTEENKEQTEIANKPTRNQPKYAEIVIEKSDCDFGQIESGKLIAHTFKIRNRGAINYKIRDINSECTCISIEDYSKNIPPQGDGFVSIIYDSSKKTGNQQENIVLTGNTSPTRSIITIRGNVVSLPKKQILECYLGKAGVEIELSKSGTKANAISDENGKLQIEVPKEWVGTVVSIAYKKGDQIVYRNIKLKEENIELPASFKN